MPGIAPSPSRPERALARVAFGVCDVVTALLVATGIRISEALALRMDHVTPDGLIIRETKFRKSRLVPIHATSRQAVIDYLVVRQHAGGDPHLFVSDRGTALLYPTLIGVFLRLVRALGLHPDAGHRGNFREL